MTSKFLWCGSHTFCYNGPQGLSLYRLVNIQTSEANTNAFYKFSETLMNTQT